MAAALAGERHLDNMQIWTLLPHPDTPEPAVRELSVEVERVGAELNLRFMGEGDLDQIAWPDDTDAQFTDGLWQHTCFEVFVRGIHGASYFEGNFSPSTEYAFYAFSGYREGMTAIRHGDQPCVGIGFGDNQFSLFATLDLAEIAPEIAALDWTIGLSAVIENANGQKSYHALAHPGGAPDFHHAACFALELKA